MAFYRLSYAAPIKNTVLFQINGRDSKRTVKVMRVVVLVSSDLLASGALQAPSVLGSLLKSSHCPFQLPATFPLSFSGNASPLVISLILSGIYKKLIRVNLLLVFTVRPEVIVIKNEYLFYDLLHSVQ
jgi:hypothetical protein